MVRWTNTYIYQQDMLALRSVHFPELCKLLVVGKAELSMHEASLHMPINPACYITVFLGFLLDFFVTATPYSTCYGGKDSEEVGHVYDSTVNRIGDPIFTILHQLPLRCRLCETIHSREACDRNRRGAANSEVRPKPGHIPSSPSRALWTAAGSIQCPQR